MQVWGNTAVVATTVVVVLLNLCMLALGAGMCGCLSQVMHPMAQFCYAVLCCAVLCGADWRVLITNVCVPAREGL